MSRKKWEKRLGIAYDEWALVELKQVSQRNFEFSKHLFAVSAGSFAIFCFLGETVSFTNCLQLVGLFLLALSVLLAILIAEPPDFVIDGTEDLVGCHSDYSKNGKRLRRFWLIVWIIGIAAIITSHNPKQIDSGHEITMQKTDKAYDKRRHK